MLLLNELHEPERAELGVRTPDCRTDRQDVFDSTFNANRRKEHGALDKASK